MIRIFDTYGDKYEIGVPASTKNGGKTYRYITVSGDILEELSYEQVKIALIYELAMMLDLKVTNLILKQDSLDIDIECERGQKKLSSRGLKKTQKLEAFTLFIYKSFINCWDR